jgi:Family of unknown function (DUF6527)
MTAAAFQPEFAEYIPSGLEPGILYVSLKYSTAVHLCACGCGRKVVTPLSPAGWRLTFDGTVSINPSIGNWQYPCQSHYFIRSNQVIWARRFTPDKIRASQWRDAEDRQAHYEPTTIRKRPRTRLRRLLTALTERTLPR